LDYRDLWTGNLYTSRPARPATTRDEAKLLADCAAVTIVSPSWGLALERRFGLGSKLHIVSNGYDPEELAHVTPLNFGHAAIVYTGTFYPPKRVITPIMAVLKRLKEITNAAASEWYFHYYGTKGDHVRMEAEHFGVIERVVLHGEVSRAEALSAVRGASVAVVITSVTKDPTLADQGMITGKVFEAIGLGTPILLVAPSHSDTAMVAETTGLARHFTANEIEDMTSFLKETLYGRTPKLGHRDDYAWPNIAKKMDHILRTAIKSTMENRKTRGEKQK
jgi:glycosyltransferase involved in cell wall biosynthesis